MPRTAPSFILRVIPEGSRQADPVDLRGRVTSFVFTDDEKQPDKLEIMVDNFDYANFDNPIVATGAMLEFQYGYGDGIMSPLRQAVVTKVTGGAQLKVEAQGKALLMNTTPRVRSFTKMKRSEIVAQIASENGYGEERQFIQDTVIVFDHIAQAKLTDHQFIRDLAHREGFEFFVDYRGLHFHERDLKQAPRRRFTYYTDRGQGDITSPPEVKNDITAKAGAVVAKGIDPMTMQPINERADNDSTAGRGGLGGLLSLLGIGDKKDASAAAPDAPVVGKDGRLVSPDKRDGAKTEGRLRQDAVVTTTATDKDDAKRRATGAYKKLQLSAVQLNFEAVGDPSFEAKSVCEVVGLGRNLSGCYYVTKVKHSLAGSYTMSVETKRDSSPLSSDHDDTKADVNTKKPPNPPVDDLVRLKRKNPRTGEFEYVWVPRGSVAP